MTNLNWKLLTKKRGSSTQGLPPGKEDLAWVTNTVTLIYGERDAVLVDTFLSAQHTKELIDWIAETGKSLTTIYITHAHGDHSYGNSVWTKAGATTMAFRGVVTEMDRWEPARWKAAMTKREDVRETGEVDVQRPQKIIDGDRFVLKDKTREVRFLFELF